MKNFFTDLWDGIVNGIPDVLLAILFLIVAFLVALLVKKIVMAILRKTGAEKLLARTGVKDEKTGKSTEFIGKLVFLIVFLLFLPEVLARLGMDNVASPITNMINSIIAFLPNLLAAGVILAIGIYIAKVIRQLVKALLDRIGLDKLQKKLVGDSVEDKNKFTGVIAGIVYVLILIPIIIAALQALNLEAVSVPAMTILSQIFDYVPSIFVAVILLVVGYHLAKILASVLESFLVGIGADNAVKKLFMKSEESKLKFSIAKISSEVVRWVIIIVFFVEAVNVLNLDIFTNIGAVILGYLPLVVSAIVIMGGGIILASWVEGLILKHSSEQKTIAVITKIIILVMAGFMTLSQLGFAENIVNLAFAVIIAGAAVAFAIAFGVGGRTFAANRLNKLEKKLDSVPETDKKD